MLRRCGYITQTINTLNKNRFYIGWGMLIVLIGLSLCIYGQIQDLWLSAVFFSLTSGLLAIILGTFEPRNDLVIAAGSFLAIIGIAVFIQQFVNISSLSLVGIIIAFSGALVVLRYLRRDSHE